MGSEHPSRQPQRTRLGHRQNENSLPICLTIRGLLDLCLFWEVLDMFESDRSELVLLDVDRLDVGLGRRARRVPSHVDEQ